MSTVHCASHSSREDHKTEHVSVAEFRKNLSSFLFSAHEKNDVIYVFNYRKPYASIVSSEDGHLVDSIKEDLSEEDAEILKSIIDEEKHKGKANLREILNRFFHKNGNIAAISS